MHEAKWLLEGHDFFTKEGAFVKWYDSKFFLLIHNGKKFHGELVEDASESQKLIIKINHRVFELKRKGELDALISSLGLDKPKIRKMKELHSPMPGRVVQLFVSVGDVVNPGDNLLSLEAMKMENILKAEGFGKVKSIHILGGDVVDKGAILIAFEED
ncbi:MAG: acetyl-CoA carboxylase biotin carboxyl carrier protein subunit [Bacteroidetes bacterium]|nr:acetyl-CoA carboxylase biotin carboxyl carrier protein subunit [Bacteroidota bacterium]